MDVPERFTLEDLTIPAFISVKEMDHIITCGGFNAAWAQRKYDGHYAVIGKHKDGTFFTATKNHMDIWTDALRDICDHERESMPSGTWFAGELYKEGMPATSVVSCINSVDRELVFMPFHIGALRGRIYERDIYDFYGEVRNYVRRKWIWAENGGSQPHCRAGALDQIGPDWFMKLKEEAKDKGWEGWVVKSRDYKKWCKVKVSETIDVVVTGYELSTAKSWPGALKHVFVSLRHGEEWVEVASVGTGFTREFRTTVDPESLIGQVCEVQYDGLAAKGRLKHPRFVAWRDDKEPNQCGIGQLVIG